MRKMTAIVACAWLLSSGAGAQESPGANQALYAMSLFGEGCFKTSGKPDRVSAWAQAAGMRTLSEASAKIFLAGRTGTAWEPLNAAGNFVVSVADNGFCSVYARKVGTSELKQMYLAFLPGPATNLTVTQVVDASKPSPQGEIHTLGHAIGRPGAPFRINTVLSTSDSEQASMQGILSLALTPQ